jgi:hypothetical protein
MTEMANKISDPDPTIHYQADPDPDLYLMRIRIRSQFPKMIRIHILQICCAQRICKMWINSGTLNKTSCKLTNVIVTD